MVAVWGDEGGTPNSTRSGWTSPMPSSSGKTHSKKATKFVHSSSQRWAAVLLLLLCAAGAVASEEGSCTSGDELTCRDDSEGFGGGTGHSSRSLLQTSCNCHGHGACAAAGPFMCSCEFGWNPASNCSKPTDCSTLEGCNGHGICVKGPECRCDPPWSGSTCNVSTCPRGCSGHGTCQNGVCLCDIGWREELISCSLRSCVGNCTNGVCVDGDCECNPGYSGEDCETFECINECSGHGTCDLGLVKCVCFPWYTGEDCSTALCPANCSGNGICSNGVCVCDNRHAGYDCSIPKCPHDCSGRGVCLGDSTCSCQTGYYGAGCEIFGNCPIANCSGHGTCADSTCICDSGWMGDGCEQEAMVQDVVCMGNCSSHGTCLNGTCICDAGWLGADCSMTVGCPNDCSGNGACANGTCVCDVGWTATDCSLRDGVAFCAQNCSSGFGVFLNGTCDCSIAAPGQETLCLNNCTGNGVCENGVCLCDLGYNGADCSAVVGMRQGDNLAGCPGNCSNHGSCVNGTCICDMGWTTVDCSEQGQAPGGLDCPSNCTGQGSCVNGTCFCDMGFLGPACDRVVGPAEACPSNCSGHGSCVNSTCWCDQGYSGPACSTTRSVNASDLGSTPVPASAPHVCPEGCSGRGACVDGTCVCDPLYTGEACQTLAITLMAGCPRDCSNQGTCVNGTCLCDRPYHGVDCATISLCPGHTPSAGNCSGRGDCVNGTCVCDGGWSGPDCSVSTCRMDCSGHGMCSNGTCLCDFGWRGAVCGAISCPKDCSGHGSCSADMVQPTCDCDAGWTGADCSMRMCPTADPALSCSGHGACAQNGTCICYQDYVGDDCSILQECKGRGFKRCGFCDCEEGFAGSECELDVCQDSRKYHPEFPTDWRQSTVCSERGVCTTGRGCVCEAGWAGKNCSVPAVCSGKPPGSRDPPPPEGWAVGCGSGSSCSGSRDSPGTCTCGVFTIADSPFPTPRFTNLSITDTSGKFIGWIPCGEPECPGLIIDPVTGVRTECSGTGSCVKNAGSSPFCSCYTVTNEGLYSGTDCGVPPVYRISEISPKVGPLEGGATITIRGPGIERVLPGYGAAGLFCDFQATERVPVQVGIERDTLLCVAPSQPTARTVLVTLQDVDFNPILSSTASFEYFEQTEIIRMGPTFGPLRPIPPAKNSITVTGSYFPRNGIYQCKFGDCASPSARRVDQVTVVCEMPTVARGTPLPITVSSDAQTFSEEGGREALFTAYEITSISPRCASQEGVAVATVFGRNLVDGFDTTRNPNQYVCSFGRGSTKFYSLAVVSDIETSALECPTPSNSLEQEDDFALSLDAEETLPGTGIYDGRWDQTPTVTFNTYVQPSIERVVSSPYLIAPTVGPTRGGTYITIAGFGFQYSAYGLNNPYFDSWQPTMPGCNPLGIPTCSFGTTVTNEMTIVSENLVICRTPALLDSINTGKTVRMEIALDGQSYTGSGSRFQFVEPWAVTDVFPTSGVASGGTLLTVQGSGFVDSISGGDMDFPEVLSCVFVSQTDSNVKTIVKATFSGPDEVTCITQDMGGSSFTNVFVSLSGQLDDTQLGSSTAAFRFYLDPTVKQIVHPVGSISRDVEVKVEGENFEEMGNAVLCRFGYDPDMIVEGRYVDTKTVFCQPPIVDQPMTVNVSLSFNGFDWTNEKLYTFYQLVSMSPSSGPMSGGTIVTIKINGGKFFNHSLFEMDYTVRFGDGDANNQCPGNCVGARYVAASDSILIETSNQTNSPLQRAGKRREVYLQLTTNGPFERFDLQFIFYDASYSSVRPCLQSSCKELSVPRDGRPYAVTFRGFGLFDLETATCAFLPMVSGQPDGKQEFNRFQQGILTGSDAMFSQAQFEGMEDGRGELGCIAPGLNGTAEGFYVSVALNGLNYVHEVFNLFYLDQPLVTSLSHDGGLFDQSLRITVTATSWTLPSWYTVAHPSTLSCLFFAPQTDEGLSVFKFASAENPSCSGGVCTATCSTPLGFEPTSDAVLKTQVFISLNRRDPCMECRTSEYEVGDTYDRESLISKFDGNASNGFCSVTEPLLRQDTRVMTGSCSTPTDAHQWYTFFANPIVRSLSPGAVVLHNVTVPIVLAGEHFKASSWREWSSANYEAFPDQTNPPKTAQVHARATYHVRGQEKGSIVLPSAYYNWETDAMILNVPTPCLNTSTSMLTEAQILTCYSIVNFVQDSRRLDVTFELSLNDGAQFSTVSKFLQVYDVVTCPDTGCGHGACVADGPGVNADLACQCGIWDYNASDACFQSTSRWLRSDLSFLYLQPRSIFKSPDDPFTASNYFSPPSTFLRGTSSPNELACTAGPLLTAATPTVGSIRGETIVTIDLAVFTASGIVFSQGDNVVCYFGTCRTNATLTYLELGDAAGGKSTVERYQCTAPPVPSTRGSVDLVVTFENALGIRSPLNFDGRIPFIHYIPPTITNIYTLGGERDRNSLLSVPICGGGAMETFLCDREPYFQFRIEGTDFLDVDLLGCNAGGITNRAQFVDEEHVVCEVSKVVYPQTGTLQVTLDDQVFTSAVGAPRVLFYNPPKAWKDSTRSFGVDPQFVGAPLEKILGYDPGIIELGQYSQVAPVTGGTPVVFYMADPPKPLSGAQHFNLSYWGQQGTMRLRFGQCQSSCPAGTPYDDRYGLQCESDGLPSCSCDRGMDVQARLDSTAGADANENQIWKLQAETPEVGAGAAGRHMMCFSANGVHYLPMIHGQSADNVQDRFYFTFYEAPQVTSLHLTAGPVLLPEGRTYRVNLIGANFLQKVLDQRCDLVEIGLCPDHVPRLFVYVGGHGLTAKGWAVPVSSDKITTISSTEMSFEVPDMRQVPNRKFVANITVSYNGWDWTPVAQGDTEFSFFRYPEGPLRMTPRWSHIDFPTVIQIIGRNFDQIPERTMCRFADCADSSRFVLVPAVYFNSTVMTCESPPRLRVSPGSIFMETVEQLCVSYTPDGTESTRLATPELYDLLFQSADEEIGGVLNIAEDVVDVSISASAAPITGGTDFTILIDNLEHMGECLDYASIDQALIVFLPTSPTWNILRPINYGETIPVHVKSFHPEDPPSFDWDPQNAVFKLHCKLVIYVTLPQMPFPMTADLRFSFNGGQKFVGPAVNVLFYRQLAPASVIPVRGSSTATTRPDATFYFTSELLEGANPTISSSTANFLFKGATDCNMTTLEGPEICPRGPRCRFMIPGSLTQYIEVEGTYTHDSEQPTLECTVPTTPRAGATTVDVTLDGVNYVRNVNPPLFLYYEQPCVQRIYPTNGLWEAETEITVFGSGFLQNNPGEAHQLWCIFDFQDLVPSEISWNVRRTWSIAYAICETAVVCRVPPIAEKDRPLIPANPRARVGIIVDGRCSDTGYVTGNKCASLLNADREIMSAGYFLYHNTPTLSKVTPQAGFISGGLEVTITGDGYLEEYRVGHTAGWPFCDTQSGGLFETRPFEKLCSNNESCSQVVSPCSGLTCRFGNISSPAKLITATEMVCETPLLSGVTGTVITSLSVSLNGKAQEFAFPLNFIYADTEVISITPTGGAFDGGDVLRITGENYVNTTACAKKSSEQPDLGACLQCRFQGAPIDGTDQFTEHYVEATFVSATMVTCAVPSGRLMGYTIDGTDERCGESCKGQLSVQVSPNGEEFTHVVDSAKFGYLTQVTFAGFHPNAGSTIGNSNITILGSGFSSTLMVWCKFDDTTVRAYYVNPTTLTCITPARDAAVEGGVFLGFSVNNENFCSLAPDEGQASCDPDAGNCVCEYSEREEGEPGAFPFFYHDVMTVLNIVPPAGKRTGATPVHVIGTGFQDYGQRLSIWFGSNITAEATIVNDTHIKCHTPAMPDVIGPNGLALYWLDNAVAIRVTSNNQSFTEEEAGDDCTESVPGNDLTTFTPNPQGYCAERFVMFSWFEMPTVTLLRGKSFSGFYSKLHPILYDELRNTKDIPQGPTSGGTTITLLGSDFTSLSRPTLQRGQISGVACNVDASDPTCRVACDFPFGFENQFHYQCINTPRDSTQTQPEYWCSVGGSITYDGKYGTCNTTTSVWKDYRQAGKVITRLQCKFGSAPLVDAIVVDNSTIKCTSPPSEDGIIVPVSVTLNGKDFTQVNLDTYFQYLQPAPEVLSANLSSTADKLTVTWDVPTNLQGLQNPSRVMPPENDLSGCLDLFSSDFVATLGQTIPECKWSADSSQVVITVGSMASFQPGDIVEFVQRSCEIGGQDECSANPTASDLLIFPRKRIGCFFPRLGECVQTQSEDPNWCGRCIPDDEVQLIELSYSFLQNTQDLKIRAPENPVLPNPIIVGPKTVDTCQTLCMCDGCAQHGEACSPTSSSCPGYCGYALTTLDGTGSWGAQARPWQTISWTLSVSGTTDPSIATNLSKIDDLVAVIPMSPLARALPLGGNVTYCIHLHLVNWLGAEAITERCHSLIQYNTPLPSIVIVSPPSSLSTIGAALSLTALVQESACTVQNPVYSYAWTADPEPEGWGNIDNSTLSLSVRPYEVAWSAVPYKFTLHTTFQQGPTSERTTTVFTNDVTVTFVTSPPKAVIAKGHRYVGTQYDLDLDGSGSYDADSQMGTDARSDLKYCWACVRQNSDSTDCNWGLAETANQFVSKDVLEVGTYTLTLTVAKPSSAQCSTLGSADVLTDSASVTITVMNGEFAPPAAFLESPSFQYITDGAALRLSGTVHAGSCTHATSMDTSCSVEYFWTITPPLIQDVQGRTTPSYDPLQTDAEKTVTSTQTGYGTVALIVAAKQFGVASFEDSTVYTFTLTVRENDMEVHSFISLLKNPAPSGGTFAVSPSKGIALDTVFTFSCDGWVDENLPLYYQFFMEVNGQPMSLGPPSLSTSIKRYLPRGDTTQNDQLILSAIVYDGLLAGAQTRTATVEVELSTSFNITKLTNDMINLVENLYNSGDSNGAILQLGIIGHVLNEPELAGATKLREYIMPTFGAIISGTKRRASISRRLMQFSTAPKDPADLENGIAGFLLTITVDPATATRTECIAAFDILIPFLGQFNVLAATDTESKIKSNAQYFITIAQKCQQAMTEASDWNNIYEAVRYVGLLYMKNRAPLESVQFGENDMGVTFKRFSTTLQESEVEVEPEPGVNPLKVTIPSTVMSRVDTSTFSLFDFQGIAFMTGVNPFDTLSNTTVNSRVFSGTIRAAADLSVSVVSDPSFEDLSIRNLRDPITIYLETINEVEANIDPETGVYTASVCSYWNGSTTTWNQFGEAKANLPTSQLACPTVHLSDFGISPGRVGCDDTASEEPIENNVCGVCGGGEPQKLTGICDWEGVPCKEPNALDDCKVCNGQNAKFRGFSYLNETGICDYRGRVCGLVTTSDGQGQVNSEPTVCGICDRPENQQTRTRDGICDCNRMPHGTAVLDRCGICGGGNATMDDCGVNGAIPADLVCHPQGLNPNWNRACTGCDERPEPLMPWSPSTQGFPYGIGGVRDDMCGICGGDGSTCTGCGGKRGAVEDICGVCEGDGSACRGCDGVSRPIPYQVDSCGQCMDPEDGFFGACDRDPQTATTIKCNYTTFEPKDLCRQDCAGELKGRVFDRCGICGGPNTANCDALALDEYNWTEATGCRYLAFTDECGKCGGDGSSCLGCSNQEGVSGEPFSGLVPDLCGVCEGDDTSCIGCDNEINSGKVEDDCGVCDGGNAAKDICGVCFGDNSMCAGCDGRPYSGKAVDACDVCGGNNYCKWRDGDPPPESEGSFEAVVLEWQLAENPNSARRSAANSVWGALVLALLALARAFMQ